MANTTTRRYGMPFTGYIGSQLRHTTGPGALTKDSTNWVLDPVEKKWVRRRGTTDFAQSVLESDWTAKGRQVFEINSDSLTNGQPTLGALFAAESKHYGQVFYRNTNVGSPNTVVGQNFSATTYPTVSAVPGIRYWPLCYEGIDANGVTIGAGLTRGGTANNTTQSQLLRQFLAAGSRRVVQVGRWLLTPNFYGTPARWSCRFNDSTVLTSQPDNLIPTGQVSPLYTPTAAKSASSADGSWHAYDQFYMAVAFQDETGAWSMPVIPRAKQAATLTSGYGLVTVDSTVASNADYVKLYPYMLYTNIPIGPPGTKARAVLRSPKVNAFINNATDVGSSLSTSAYVAPDPTDLRIIVVLKNNTQTSYYDYNGMDSSLAVDDFVVRYDQVWPPRARYIFTFDQRVGIGYVRPNPAAIVLAPTGANSSRDLNAADDSATVYGSVTQLYRITRSAAGVYVLELKKDSGGVTTTLSTTITALTMQDIVDAVCATVVGGNGGEWAAQLVPNSDSLALGTQLAPTIATYTNCTAGSGSNSLAVTDATYANDIVQGMRVSGANIQATTYVTNVSVSGSVATVTLSLVTSGAITAGTVLFSVDTGDDRLVHDSTLGNVRAFAPSFPSVLYFGRSWQALQKTDKRSVYFTGGGPLHPNDAFNAWYAQNSRTVPAFAGAFVGAANVANGTLLLYTGAVFLLKNAKGGGTGLDEDYRVYPINRTRGCISPFSIVEGDGWAAYLTPEGIAVCDGDTEKIISAAVWNPERRNTGGATDYTSERGEWEYEITQCQVAASGDTDDFEFRSLVDRGRLYVTYRRSSSAGDYAQMQYDFSPSIEANGLAEVLDENGQPYGWSTPLTGARLQAMGVVRVINATGPRYIATSDANGQGRLMEFNLATTQTDTVNAASTQVSATGYCLTDLCDTSRLKSAKGCYVLYRKNGASMKLDISRDKSRTSITSGTTPSTQMTLPSSGTADFARLWVELPLASRAPGEVVEFKITDDSGTVPGELIGIELDVDILNSHQ